MKLVITWSSKKVGMKRTGGLVVVEIVWIVVCDGPGVSMVVEWVV